MWSVFIPTDRASTDALSADLWELDTAGWVEEAYGLRAFFEDAADQNAICAKLGLSVAEVRHEAAFDVNQVKVLACEPILIGERFFVSPSWVTEPTPAGRFRLTIDATNAFGSGRHESTQMCIEVLEKHLKAGHCVADVGCGSGILTAAATLLGAGAVFSCDIHEESVRTARTLIETPVFVGSADGMRSGAADLVLANLSVRILDVVAGDLQRIARPDGLIVLGGFLHENPPKKFTPWEVWQKGDWECWVCRREEVIVGSEPSGADSHAQQWWL